MLENKNAFLYALIHSDGEVPVSGVGVTEPSSYAPILFRIV